ncbi:MAG TPA: CHC2 zinc finger domain-containing protein, partial [Aggregatilineales bacterium]|nr:CHC2 zinc finger domain-containing protein [Aggregatilineales bacterium]
MSQIDEIKNKLDIVAYIQQYASLKKAGRTYKACCPFHSEKTPSFVVNPDKQTWRCFGACNEGGDIFSFAQKYHNWGFAEALEELGKMAGVEIRPHSPLDRQKEERKERLRGLMKAASDYFHAQLHNGSFASGDVLRYAKEKRGFSDETITRYQIGYAPQGWQHLHDEFIKIGYSQDELLETGLVIKNDAGRVYDRFRHRLMIPIRDDKGHVIAFGARALNPDDQPKYLNSPQTPLFDKSHTLFGLDVA